MLVCVTVVGGTKPLYAEGVGAGVGMIVRVGAMLARLVVGGAGTTVHPTATVDEMTVAASIMREKCIRRIFVDSDRIAHVNTKRHDVAVCATLPATVAAAGSTEALSVERVAQAKSTIDMEPMHTAAMHIDWWSGSNAATVVLAKLATSPTMVSKAPMSPGWQWWWEMMGWSVDP